MFKTVPGFEYEYKYEFITDDGYMHSATPEIKHRVVMRTSSIMSLGMWLQGYLDEKVQIYNEKLELGRPIHHFLVAKITYVGRADFVTATG